MLIFFSLTLLEIALLVLFSFSTMVLLKFEQVCCSAGKQLVQALPAFTHTQVLQWGIAVALAA